MKSRRVTLGDPRLVETLFSDAQTTPSVMTITIGKSTVAPDRVLLSRQRVMLQNMLSTILNTVKIFNTYIAKNYHRISIFYFYFNSLPILSSNAIFKGDMINTSTYTTYLQ